MQKPDYSHPVDAIRAPVDGRPIQQAAFVPRGRPYQVCTRCVMDTTDPEIEFDEQGVCSHCRYFDNSVKPLWPSVDGDPAKLEEMIRTVKAYGKGRRYDCIIGLSGGIDSSYICLLYTSPSPRD